MKSILKKVFQFGQAPEEKPEAGEEPMETPEEEPFTEPAVDPETLAAEAPAAAVPQSPEDALEPLDPERASLARMVREKDLQEPRSGRKSKT